MPSQASDTVCPYSYSVGRLVPKDLDGAISLNSRNKRRTSLRSHSFNRSECLNENLCHFAAGRVACRCQDEGPDIGAKEGRYLGPAVADVLVFCQHDPAPSAN